MQTSVRLLGLFFSSTMFLAAGSGCTSGPRASGILTGKLEVAPTASTPSRSSELARAPGAVGVTIRTTGWKLDQLLVGRCVGACDEAEVDAWLVARADTLYGLGYGCPLGAACVDHPNAWGFEETAYGTCPDNVHSVLNPIVTDAELGLVDDIGMSTDCSASAPVLVEGPTYWVTGFGLECFHDSFDDCDEVRGVRFFKIEKGQIVDVGGTADDRRPVRFENVQP